MIYTLLCTIKVNSNLNELIVHTSCYCVFVIVLRVTEWQPMSTSTIIDVFYSPSVGVKDQTAQLYTIHEIGLTLFFFFHRKYWACFWKKFIYLKFGQNKETVLFNIKNYLFEKLNRNKFCTRLVSQTNFKITVFALM